MPEATADQIAAFIARWESSGAAERANYQMFLAELCDILGVPRPDPTSPDPAKNRYVFDRAITRIHPDGSTATNYIDLYRAGCFVCETKQGEGSPGILPASPESRQETRYRSSKGAPASGPQPEAHAGGTPALLSPSQEHSPGRDAHAPLDSKARASLPRTPTPQKTGHGKRGTAAFDKALERAYHQARGYITALPVGEGRPPFLIVCDVGHTLDLYAEFTGTGGQYERFPDPVSYRLTLADLHRPEIRDRLRKVWLDPQALDPSKIAAAVTRDIAGRLALLAKSLEADGHPPQTIAGFLQRSLFTMFAEDVGLLPGDGFKTLLARAKDNPLGFPVLVSGLWKEMAAGTAYSSLLFQEIACFNGGLFEDTTALPLSAAQIAMLADAAATDWSGVEPSIFGTLLVRALDPRERHKLGAEFTPRSYVERLIRPAVIGPLREEWEAVRIAAVTLQEEAAEAEAHAEQLEAEASTKMHAGANDAAKQLGAEAARLHKEADKKEAAALAQVTAFHRYLCGLTVLDPACGTANFLYVTMEHMKRLEAEVLELLAALGGDPGMEMQGFRVRPEHFLGLEVNKQAVAIAQLVLWIGYFQWQHRTTGQADTGDRPLLPKDRSIFEQDAVLAYDARVPRTDPATGTFLTVWDGHTTKPHPVTGKEVPDESARSVVFDYTNPRRAEWPKADFIVGNPPFIGASRMREALGDGYVEALREAWKGDVPESADFVMFWWRKAAELVRDGKARRFGFITTNSIHQTFNRRVIEPFLADAKKPLHLAYAIPDHPWIDSADGAAVRIAMTVAAPGRAGGVLEKVTTEQTGHDGEVEVTLVKVGGVLAPNLQIGADLTSCDALLANSKVSCPGVKLHGSGFIVTPEQASQLGLGSVPGIERHIRGYRNGKDLTDKPRGVMVIDLFGLSDAEAAARFPTLFQHVVVHVKPERDQNARDTYRLNWWIFGEPRRDFRPALAGLPRYIATVETSKHRFFTFLDESILPDNMLVAISSDDALHLAVLSSSIHVIFALAAGGRLGMGNDPRYNKSRCFDPFPFPALEEGELKQRLRALGERLDAHRKRQQEQHPGLTLTGIYNVLQKLRTGEALGAKDKTIHDQGLVSVLKQIHDDLDAAVLEAYGWSDLQRSTGVPPVAPNDHGQDARAPLGAPLGVLSGAPLGAPLNAPSDSPFFDVYREIHAHARNLPHWQQNDSWIFVTWRLADSLPADKLAEWREEKDAWLRQHGEPWDAATTREFHEHFTRRMEAWIDAGHGSCVLRQEGPRGVVVNALRHFDGERYVLGDFVVMPNHVHVLFRPKNGHLLADIIHSWKSFTAKAINQLLSRTGPLWQEEYWDRLVRNERHLAACEAYIAANPREAKLSRDAYFYQRSTPIVPVGREEQRSTGVPPVAPNDHGQDAHAPSTGVPPVAPNDHGQDARAPLGAPLADVLARGGPQAEALEQQILTRLVALNHERAAEEKRGHIRWLRPDYQACGLRPSQPSREAGSNDQGTGGHRPPLQAEIEGLDAPPAQSPSQAWPDELPAQVAAIRHLLPSVGPDPDLLAAQFGRKSPKRTAQITAILTTLRALGHIA